jgi:hypothetical protein
VSSQIYQGDYYGGVFLPPSDRDNAIRDAVENIYRLFDLSETNSDRQNSHEILTYALVLADMKTRRRL